MIKEIIELKVTEKEIVSLLEKLTANGTCYEDALHYMQDNIGDDKLRLVHGLVNGQGELSGIVYNHAWVESGNEVIDPSLKNQGRSNYKFPKPIYYAIGGMREKTVFRYTHKEMSRKMLDVGTYGPWEKILIKNKY